MRDLSELKAVAHAIRNLPTGWHWDFSARFYNENTHAKDCGCALNLEEFMGFEQGVAMNDGSEIFLYTSGIWSHRVPFLHPPLKNHATNTEVADLWDRYILWLEMMNELELKQLPDR